MQSRKLLWSRLEQAERHVAEGFNHLQVQRRIVADLERGGHEKPLTMARKILQQFESVQKERLSDRDRLFEALSGVPELGLCQRVHVRRARTRIGTPECP
jgi:hypothetical protein